MRHSAIAAAMVMTVAAASSAPARDAADDTITLRNARGMTVRLIPFGATVTAIEVPDRTGRNANVLLGFATPAEFRAKNGKVSFGATIGRYAGRIAGARFARRPSRSTVPTAFRVSRAGCAWR